MKMFKYLMMALMCLISSSLMADDTPIPIEQLPETARSFVQTNFKGQKIMYAEKDWNSFECRLADGTKIEFSKKGAWKKIDRKNVAVPEGIVPETIIEYVKANFEGCVVTKIDKERYGYDIELSNDIDLKFNYQGVLIGMDD
ncbi:MAG: PepSY-like domain-containing protein [Bacteroidaceae bacterium]|nr:PepSY-like domain-containing protein [Bacteroidaceae bacterium]